jgi:hypothetical protein
MLSGALRVQPTHHLVRRCISTRFHYSYHGPGHFHRSSVNRSNFKERAFTVGIGGPVGSGKTALVLQLCSQLQHSYPNLSLGVVTNDIFTQEDAEYLIKQNVLPQDRVLAVETGGCPHAAIREDVSANLSALEKLTRQQTTSLLLCESGGDNLAANFSSELADFTGTSGKMLHLLCRFVILIFSFSRRSSIRYRRCGRRQSAAKRWTRYYSIGFACYQQG